MLENDRKMVSGIMEHSTVVKVFEEMIDVMKRNGVNPAIAPAMAIAFATYISLINGDDVTRIKRMASENIDHARCNIVEIMDGREVNLPTEGVN